MAHSPPNLKYEQCLTLNTTNLNNQLNAGYVTTQVGGIRLKAKVLNLAHAEKMLNDEQTKMGMPTMQTRNNYLRKIDRTTVV